MRVSERVRCVVSAKHVFSQRVIVLCVECCTARMQSETCNTCHQHNSYMPWRGVGVTTVEVRVCGSAGRDKNDLEEKFLNPKKGASITDRGMENSDSEGKKGEGRGEEGECIKCL